MSDLDHEIAQVLAKLSICSEVSAANLDSSSRDSGEDIGGKRPPGGIDHEGNRERDWPLKDISHFRRRLDRAHSEQALRAILADAERALEAWRRRPKPTKAQEPIKDDPFWRRYIAESTENQQTLADRYGISQPRISQIKREYLESVA